MSSLSRSASGTSGSRQPPRHCGEELRRRMSAIARRGSGVIASARPTAALSAAGFESPPRRSARCRRPDSRRAAANPRTGETDISDLAGADQQHPTTARLHSDRHFFAGSVAHRDPRMSDPNCSGRHDARDISRTPLLSCALSSRGRAQWHSPRVSRSAPAAPRSAEASTRTSVGSDGSPPAGASNSARVLPAGRRS